MSKPEIGYTQEDYKKALGREIYDTNTGDSTTDYYNALKNESYKTLLNSEVQASIARDQALKYTNNSLRAQGYGNQGMAQSTNLGAYSQYQNALANAANTYRTSVDTISTQQLAETQKQQDEDFKSISTLMESAGSREELNNVITQYGGKFDNETGAIDLSNVNLDEKSKNQLEILYAMYNNSYSLNSLDALNNATYVANDGKVHTLGAHNSEEMKYLWHLASNGEYHTGDIVQVKNGTGDTVYLKWVGSGFNIVNKEEYDKATNKYNITWQNKTIKYNKA